MSNITRYMQVLALAALGLIAGCASAEESSLKEGAREAGRTAGAAAREVGRGAKKVGKAVGDAAKEGAKAVSEAAKAGAKEFKQAVQGKGD
jgi:predicted transcriptional regulator